MKSALILNERSCHNQKPQEQLFTSITTSITTTTTDIRGYLAYLASRLKKENMPTFLSLTCLRWRYELQKSSKCVVGDAYGYSSQYTDDCYECDRIGCRFLNYFMLIGE
jgi:hypothetical protein